MNKVLIAIGSNYDAESRIEDVRVLLQDSFGEVVFSPTMQTKDVNMEGPDFINLVAVFHTNLSYQQVNALFKKLQTDCGNSEEARRRNEVAMDLDILAFNNRLYHLNDWKRPYIQQLVAKII
jgi:2-amino-4-hydroxy-6-hydroxymethyldihydropteridine diphosphokinase